MIDIALAEEVMSHTRVGDMVDVWLDDVMHTREVLDTTEYSVTLQGPTNKLTVPIEFLDAYRKQERTEQVRMPLPQKGATRGRPVKRENVAPVEPPSLPGADSPPGGWLPPGTLETPPAATVGQSATISFIPVEPSGQVNTAEHDDTFDPAAWAQETINQASADFIAAVAAVPDMIRERLTVFQAVEPAKSTCLDCAHSNISKGWCDKFQMFPPMFVVLDAKTKCADFTAEDDVPFTADE